MASMADLESQFRRLSLVRSGKFDSESAHS